MLNIQYITNAKLNAYIQDLDGDLKNGLLAYLAACRYFDGTIGIETEEQIDLLISGCRIWVRYMQGIDADRQDHIEFVNQNTTYQGTRGKAFWQLIGGNIKFDANKDNILVVVKPIINSVPVIGIISQVFDFLSAGRKRDNVESLKRYTTDYLNKFLEFMSEWQAEDKILHPEKYKNTPNPNNQTPSVFSAKANQDATITVSGILAGDVVSIDGMAQSPATSSIFTSTTQKDGEHTITVLGKTLYYYDTTVKVTTKAALLSAPLAFVENNSKTVIVVVLLAIGFYILWRRSQTA